MVEIFSVFNGVDDDIVCEDIIEISLEIQCYYCFVIIICQNGCYWIEGIVFDQCFCFLYWFRCGLCLCLIFVM